MCYNGGVGIAKDGPVGLVVFYEQEVKDCVVELGLKKPSVGFEIDGAYEVIDANRACNYSAKFQSVIGTGIVSVVEDNAEKINGLNVLMKQITGRSSWEYEARMVSGVAVFRLEVDKLSCKAK